MMANKDDAESRGAKSRDHVHPRHHFLRHAHRDWRVWLSVALMLSMLLAYLVTNDLSTGSGKRPVQPTPEANMP